jgi:mevalonate kinase
MEKVVVSAPGKVILAGEHAVVYGYPAIVAAIDRRLTVTVKPGKSQNKYTGLVKFALEQILDPGEPVDLKIDSQIPLNSGLGSSAALATALVWALKPKAELEEKNRLVKIIEDFQHGKASGVDQTIVREGGFLRFQKGEFERIELPIKAAILIDSGKPEESTGDMVKQVARGNFEAEFKQIGKLVDTWQPGLIKENERLLEKIGVVGNKAKQIIRKIETIGGAAKICGAGGVKAGSGMLLAYHRDQAKLIQLIKQAGWPYFKAHLGASGVRYESD